MFSRYLSRKWFARSRLNGAVACTDRWEVLDRATVAASEPGFVAEFGVFRAESLRFIAEQLPGPIHGFDSFRGLPADWQAGCPQGKFALSAAEVAALDLPSNVELHIGPFDRTVPQFAASHPGEAASLLHIDCDLYESAVAVLFGLRSRIRPGTVVVFDELYGYPGWRHGEFRALREFVEQTGLMCDPFAYNANGEQVAIRMTMGR